MFSCFFLLLKSLRAVRRFRQSSRELRHSRNHGGAALRRTPQLQEHLLRHVLDVALGNRLLHRAHPRIDVLAAVHAAHQRKNIVVAQRQLMRLHGGIADALEEQPVAAEHKRGAAAVHAHAAGLEKPVALQSAAAHDHGRIRTRRLAGHRVVQADEVGCLRRGLDGAVGKVETAGKVLRSEVDVEEVRLGGSARRAKCHTQTQHCDECVGVSVYGV